MTNAKPSPMKASSQQDTTALCDMIAAFKFELSERGCQTASFTVSEVRCSARVIQLGWQYVAGGTFPSKSLLFHALESNKMLVCLFPVMDTERLSMECAALGALDTG